MAAAVIGSLRVVLGLDSAELGTGLTQARKQLRDTGRQFQAVGAQMAGIGAGLSVAITAPLIAAGFHLLKGSQDAAAAAAQVEAALESMGGASGKTAEELQKSAEALRNLTGIDDDDILKSVTANMLTFGNVAGATFDRAQLAVLNLSARMEGDLQGATMMIGKALNDPVKGLAALGRAGVQFTAQQKAQIKAMAEVGDMAGAQAIMLGELEKQFGGAAKAAADADVWTPLKTGLMDLEGAFEPIIRNVLAPVIAKVAEVVKAFAGLSPSVQGMVVAGAAIAAALGPALVVLGTVVSAVGSLTVALASGGVLAGLAAFAAAAVPFVAAGAAIAAVIWAFRDDLAPVFEEFRAAAEAALGPALQEIMTAAQEAFAALGPAVSAVVAVVGPLIGSLASLFLKAFGPAILSALKILAAGIGSAFSTIAAVLRVITALFRGDWAGAWNAAGSLVATIVRGMGNVVEAIFPGIGRAVGRMVEEVKGFLGRKLTEIFTGAIRKIREVGDAFHDLYVRVVGNSDIPDLVTEVGEWMAKLQQTLVDPATKATKDAGDRFEEMRERVRGIMQGLLTDREQLDLTFNTERQALEQGRSAPGADVSMIDAFLARLRAEYARDSAGLDAENLTNPTRDSPSFDFLRPFNDTMEAMNRTIERSREQFADAFADGLDAAMRGDWQGVLRAALGDIFGNAARSLGRSLFDAGGGDKGGGVNWGAAISSVFSKLPKFSSGATIPASGASGIDSQLMAFWKAPGERVDVYTPGKDQGPAGSGGNVYHMSGNLMTPEFWRQIQSDIAAGESRSNSWAVKNVPAVTQSKAAKQQQHAIGRRKR